MKRKLKVKRKSSIAQRVAFMDQVVEGQYSHVVQGTLETSRGKECEVEIDFEKQKIKLGNRLFKLEFAHFQKVYVGD